MRCHDKEIGTATAAAAADDANYTKASVGSIYRTEKANEKLTLYHFIMDIKFHFFFLSHFAVEVKERARERSSISMEGRKCVHTIELEIL